MRPPKGWPFFQARRSGKADLVLSLGVVQDCDRVAVRDANYATFNDPRLAGER
jgi:hypothetical protein